MYAINVPLICFVLFTPGLLTALFNWPLKLERLVWGGDPIPMPAGIGFSLRIGRGGPLTRMWVVQTQGNSVILRPDPPQGLGGQPKHEACWPKGNRAYP